MMENSKNFDLLLFEWTDASTEKIRLDCIPRLESLINDLLLHDFNTLLSILYRVDVNEKKLKDLLSDQPAVNASVLITGLIVDRIKEKEISRNMTKSDRDIPDDERW